MRSKTSFRAIHAFSLAEIIMVVGVTAVIVAVSIPHLGETFGRSQDVVANEVRETLNLALKKHAQVNYEFVLAADDTKSDDEFAILRSLQWRDPSDPATGAPYVRPDWDPSASSNDNDFRLAWTGRIFRVLRPGTAGHGIKVDFEATDYGENYTFPNDFAPVGG